MQIHALHGHAGATQPHAHSPPKKTKRARRKKRVFKKMSSDLSVPMERVQMRTVGQPSFTEVQDEEVARGLCEKEAVSGTAPILACCM